MKRLLIALLMTVAGLNAFGQIKTLTKPSSSTTVDGTSDTITDGVTRYMKVEAPGGSTVTRWQFDATKVSGTVSAYAVLWGSVNGTNYYETTDTVTLTNTAGVKVYTLNNGVSTWRYYRWKLVSTGTQVFAIKGYLLQR